MRGGTLLRSSAVMAAGTAVSRVLGFVRAVVLVWCLGVNFPAASAYDVANKVPSVLYMLIAGGVLNAVLVPQIVRASKDPERGQEFLDKLITLSMLIILILTVAMTATAPLLIKLYASREWSASTYQLAVLFAYLCLPQVFFYGLYTVLGQVLNAKLSFGPYMWTPVLANVVALIGLFAFLGRYGRGDLTAHDPEHFTWQMALLLGAFATLSVVAQAVGLFPALRKIGFHYRPRFGFRGVGLRTASHVAAWTFGHVAIGQVAFVLTSKVCAAAGGLADKAGPDLAARTPSNAAYTNSFLLFMLPHSLVAVSLVTALFTRMSESAERNDIEEVSRDLSLGLRVVGLVSVFATAVFVALQEPVGLVISKNPAGAQGVGMVTAAMSLGLLPFSANYLIQRVFYAFEDAKSVFWATMPTLAMMTAVNLYAMFFLNDRPQYMVVAVGFGMSLGYLVGSLTSWIMLRRKLGDLDARHVVNVHLRLGIGAVAAVAVGWPLSHLVQPISHGGQGGAAVALVICASVMLGVYLILLKLLRVEEVDQLLGMVTRRFRTA